MKKKILILDDDRNLLDILGVIMDYEGFETSLVESTDNLIPLVRAYEPALILLDYSLNGVHGGEWCKRLKREPEFAAIPVILFSAYSNKGIEKGTYGCDEFIAKPFDLDDILSCIRRLIATVKCNPLTKGNFIVL